MEDIGAPESWEIADLDESMSRLLLKKDSSKPPPQELCDGSASASASCNSSSSSSSNSSASNSAGGDGCGGEKVSEDLVNQVDQFLREAIQNPRERLSSKQFLCVFSCVFVRTCKCRFVSVFEFVDFLFGNLGYDMVIILLLV